MSTIEELELLDDKTELEFPDEIPEESRGFPPLPQPGRYVFRLPANMNTLWSRIDYKNGPRVAMAFDMANQLTIVSGRPKGTSEEYDGIYNDTPVRTFINNIERPRTSERILVSDMRYLINALEANLPDDKKSKLTNNAAYVEAMKRQAGRMFEADLHWEAFCNPKNPIRITVVDEQGNKRSQVQEGTMGCGASYNSFSRDPLKLIPRDENTGFFLERFDEPVVHQDSEGCPALLFSNVRLSRFAAVTK